MNVGRWVEDFRGGYQMKNQILQWVAFNIFVLVMLALDLGVFHRKVHVIKIKEALIWSAAWITLALLFNFGLYFA